MDSEPHFETRAERRERKRQERKLGKPTRVWWQRWYVLAMGVIVVGAVIIVPLLAPKGKAKTPTTKNNLASLQLVDSCTTDNATTYHIHAHLSLIIDGRTVDIPADSGVSSTCLHPLHTHDGTGIIHIESPTKKDFTLGDFFHVWGQTWTATELMTTKLDATRGISVFDNGSAVTTRSGTVMQDRHSYAIVVGKTGEKLTAPANYTFPTNL